MTYYGNSNFWLPDSEEIIQVVSTIELPKVQSSVEKSDEYLSFLGVRVKGMIERGVDKNLAINLIKDILPNEMLEEISLESIVNFQDNGKSRVSLATAIAEGLTIANLALIELLNRHVEFVFPLEARTDSLAEEIVGKTEFKDWLMGLNMLMN